MDEFARPILVTLLLSLPGSIWLAGQALEQQGKNKQAAKYYQQALRLAPTNQKYIDSFNNLVRAWQHSEWRVLCVSVAVLILSSGITAVRGPDGPLLRSPADRTAHQATEGRARRRDTRAAGTGAGEAATERISGEGHPRKLEGDRPVRYCVRDGSSAGCHPVGDG